MRKIGLMGGTFDPVHNGHLLAAESAREGAGLDEVWFVPAAVPPHKAEPGTSAALRLEMLRAALADNPSFRVEELELRRAGVSYTIDTVIALQEQHAGASFYWIVGTDMLNDLPNWRRIPELAERIRFIGLVRPGEEGVGHGDGLPDYIADKVLPADMPLTGISSTDIRGRVRAGRSIRYMVPEAVREIIVREALYGV